MDVEVILSHFYTNKSKQQCNHLKKSKSRDKLQKGGISCDLL